MGIEEYINAMLISIVKAATFVSVRKHLEDNEKTTDSRWKRKGGLIKRKY